jgi:hypothetical protein
MQVVDIAVGSFHTLAVKSDGTLWLWGDNGGDDLNLVPPEAGGAILGMAAGFQWSMVLKATGQVRGLPARLLLPCQCSRDVM